MLYPLFEIISLTGFIFITFSISYSLIALIQVSKIKNFPVNKIDLPPVTLLKPVCGLDADLYKNLESFCLQDYPQFQIIFGVRNGNDPAIPVISQLIKKYPNLDIDLVIDESICGTNLKISNLINMSGKINHEILVISDSDMRVCPDYLSNVVAPFEDEQVGAVTCLYKALPAKNNLASILGSIYINDWFIPSVLISKSLGNIKFCFGASIAIRYKILQKIGGFERLANTLADDYMIGNLVSKQGYKVVLSPYLVTNIVEEKNIKSLFMHELRWARTIRTVQPVGYLFSFLTHTFPLSLMFCLISPNLDLGLIVITLALVIRLRMHIIASKRLGLDNISGYFLVPFRDLINIIVWACSFLGREINWRDQNFSIQANGQLSVEET